MGSFVASGYIYRYQPFEDSHMYYEGSSLTNANKACPAPSNYVILMQDDSYYYELDYGGGSKTGKAIKENSCKILNQGREGAGVLADVESRVTQNSRHNGACYFDCFQIPSNIN